ncbi:MAG: hypothetical protein IKY04_05090 [Lachnospiraceae bacterium]|nr:hypothetical protein [Lachnospiraceae bacterium]
MEYVKVEAVIAKLKKAEETYAPVVMMAPAGYGKSAAVSYFYRRKKTLCLKCENGRLVSMPEIAKIRQSIVIIEDAQWLEEGPCTDYIKKLLYTPGIQVLVLTRGCFPDYLAIEELNLGIMRITEEDFRLGPDEIREFFEQRGVEISEDDLGKVTRISNGHPIVTFYFARHMEHGEPYSEELRAAVRDDCFHFWDTTLFETWSDEFKEFALSICPYDSFTLPMALAVTGNPNVGKVIEYCRKVMSQINYGADGVYSIRPEFRRYYVWKRNLVWDDKKNKENYMKAAIYYESNKDLGNALKFYEMAGSTGDIRRNLIENAKLDPCNGHYIEAKKYYLALPEEEVMKEPVLIAALSMLSDLLADAKKSEEWYQKLVAFEKDKTNPKEKRSEAKIWIPYLEITLPHKGVKGIIGILKSVFSLGKKGDFTFPEMSVTGDMPTIMNGGLDFGEWSKNDTQIAKLLKVPIEGVVGKYGNGLISISLAESGFEKATLSSYEVLRRCNDGYEAASHGGKAEMCFVAAGILCKQHILDGRLDAARRVFNGFKEKVLTEKADRLKPNMDAFEAWLNLYSGDANVTKTYIESVVDIRREFSIMDRYRQLVKAKCLVSENRTEEALDILSILRAYFISYERNIHYIECEILTAVILYRRKDPNWREHLLNALKKGFEYRFIRYFSIEGAAILPMLKEIKASEIGKGAADYLEEITEEAAFVAGTYPDYLLYIPKPDVSLTKRETVILSMLCRGMSMEDICEELDITYDGLKKHNRNIYRKLGAKNRAEAERKAAWLGLVHRRKFTKT